METFKKKRREAKLQSIYSRCFLERKIVLPITQIGSNMDEVIEQYVRDHFEGKCIVDGYVKPNSTKVVRKSTGVIERGNYVVFDIMFECDICLPVEGMLMSCVVKNVVKAGVRAEIANEVPSPVVVFVAKDHHYNSQAFNDIRVGDIITVKVIGQRFELNDKYVSVIGELFKDAIDNTQKANNKSKRRLIIQDDKL